MARYDDAGELNRRVTFQVFKGERDIVGDYQYLEDDNWDTVCTVWGAIKTISTREFYAAGQEQSEVTHNIKVRYRSWEANPAQMRALILGKRYRILSPALDLAGGKRYQQLKVAEVWP